MIVNFTLQEKAEILKAVIGQDFEWGHMVSGTHGKSISVKVTDVTLDETEGIKVYHKMLFEDGGTWDSHCDGSWFFDYYSKDIQKYLGVEVFWQVAPKGVNPVLLKPEELKKSDSWLIAHEYNGMIVFENYSRAMLCWYEKYESKVNNVQNEYSY